MEASLVYLKGSNKKTLLANEDFWKNVNFLIFHSEYVEINLKRGRSPSYLHFWFYEQLHSSEVDISEERRQEIYKELGCSYRFTHDSSAFIDYLYEEANKRKLIKHFR